MSNAYKYGKVGGTIETHINYDKSTQLLTIEIVNLPGEGHEDLLRLSSKEVDLVFLPGVQLNATQVAKGKHAQVV